MGTSSTLSSSKGMLVTFLGLTGPPWAAVQWPSPQRLVLSHRIDAGSAELLALEELLSRTRKRESHAPVPQRKRVLWAEQRAGLSPSHQYKVVCTSPWVLSAILEWTQVLGLCKMNRYRRKRNGVGEGSCLASLSVTGSLDVGGFDTCWLNFIPPPPCASVSPSVK